MKLSKKNYASIDEKSRSYLYDWALIWDAVIKSDSNRLRDKIAAHAIRLSEETGTVEDHIADLNARILTCAGKAQEYKDRINRALA